MKSQSNIADEDVDPSLAATSDDANMMLGGGSTVDMESVASRDLPLQEASNRTAPILTYHDHSEVKEDNMGHLVRHNLAKKNSKSSVQHEPKPSSSIDFETTSSNLGSVSTVDFDVSAPILKPVKPSKRKAVSGPRGGVYEPFPLKLHRMLATVEEAGLTSAVSWKSHGRAFQVNHVHQFVQTILPKFFRQTKLTSFQRQLNLYGFRRMIHGSDSGAYYHELFLRGRPYLCRAMVRTKVKGKSRLRAADLAGSEPDFYKLNPLPSLTEEDYRKFKNVFMSGRIEHAKSGRNEHVDVEEGSFTFSVDSNTSKKRREASVKQRRGFDASLNPFGQTGESPRSENQCWTDSQMRSRSDPEQQQQQGASLRSKSLTSLPPSYNIVANWQMNPDEFGHMQTMQTMQSAMTSSMAYVHPLQTPSHLDRLSSNSTQAPMASQSLYAMSPSARNINMGAASISAAESPYGYSQQSQYPGQNLPYWSVPPQYQYQYQATNPSGFHQYDQNSNTYSLGTENLSPISQRSMPNAKLETYTSQHTSTNESIQSQPNHLEPNYTLSDANLDDVDSDHNSNHPDLMFVSSMKLDPDSVEQANETMKTSPITFNEALTPIKNNSSENDVPISLEVDGDMKDFLDDFMNRKDS